MLKRIKIIIRNYNCKYFAAGIHTLINTSYDKYNLQGEYSDTDHGLTVVFTHGSFNPFCIKNIIVAPISIDMETIEVLIGKLREGSPVDLKEISLSNRERNILVLFILGKKDDEISTFLSINVKTVSSHIANIKNKISANTRIDLFYAFNEFFGHCNNAF
ncbi:LuxR family transcriptional regulator [Kosakonia radicincitans UMEnt01/12]|uniref:helix-turn-helix domain-containing protein n=1 Tax=Kosakonia radicincitans TaxID=283686 RepID=UPI000461B669|nr:helix-turn-helix transcriptional regulator [Kosakonia radicincitans]KDE33175.1 LuxR family transcriptional regulator [Kosakonia radicincitans UMEnt01/12]